MKVQEDVVSCRGCQPWEDGEPVWVVGQRVSMLDVLLNNNVPPNLQDEVSKDLECPNCGASIDSADDVGIRFDFEREYEAALARANRKFGKKLHEFAVFLEGYPMLGAAHPTGRRIMKEIETFPRVHLQQATWFRARRVVSGRAFSADEMRIPDASEVVVPPGRFNHYGQAHWYLASTDYTAVREVVNDGETLAWLQKWVVSPIGDILDLVQFSPDDWEPLSDSDASSLPLLATAMIFGGHLNRETERAQGWKPEYFIPHFVADAAKRSGFKGIRFTSTRSAMNVNLVIFDASAPVAAEGVPFLHDIEQAQRMIEF